MEQTLPDNHPDMARIVEAAHHDILPISPKGQGATMANALAMALGSQPGSPEDLENIEFLMHVLSVNRASGAIDDDTFERLLKHIKTKVGRAELTSRFTQQLELEHGYEDDD